MTPEEEFQFATAAEFAAELEKIPRDLTGQYLCGCPWTGAIIPHFCPKHHQPPIFEIRKPRK